MAMSRLRKLHVIRAVHHCYCTTAVEKNNKFFITTPIYYVNAAPHLGHVYSTLLADTLARWRHLKGDHVTFSTGTDEHGLKIQQSAQMAGRDVQGFCDDISNKFKDTFQSLGINYTDFIRTTEPRHVACAKKLWERIAQNGHIYRGEYSGWYSVPDEAFLSEKDIEEVTRPDGSTVKVSRDSGHEVEWVAEDNFMFRLVSFREPLLKWLDSGVITPSSYAPQIRQFVTEQLTDLSISRNRARLHWGIPVPGHPEQTMYVWLDALANYLTVSGFPDNGHQWPADCQLVGKDILKFHAVYWPAFLLAAGLPLPRRVLCHGHWLHDHKKMSKSLGNVVSPVDCMGRMTVEGFRYFLLREGTPASDNTYAHRRALETVNADLSNVMGNLLNRVTAQSLCPAQTVPAFPVDVRDSMMLTAEDRALLSDLHNLPVEVDTHFENFEINLALQRIMKQLRDTNVFVERHKPWALAKFKGRGELKDAQRQLALVLHVGMDTLRRCGVLLQPAVPTLGDRLLTRLGVPKERRAWEDAQADLYTVTDIPLEPFHRGMGLFPKIEMYGQ